MAERGTCPKCGAFSGDDWSQCGGLCPMPSSPHFSQALADGNGTDLSVIPDNSCGVAFRKQMENRTYGVDALATAWAWFKSGWEENDAAGHRPVDLP